MKRYQTIENEPGDVMEEAPEGPWARFDDAQAKIIDMQEHIDAQKLVEKIIYEHVEELKAQVAELRAALENAGEWLACDEPESALEVVNAVLAKYPEIK